MRKTAAQKTKSKLKRKDKAKRQSGIDWEELKDQFFTDLQPDGTYRYATVREFALSKAQGNKELFRTIYRGIGTRPYKGASWQGDWASDRVREDSKHDAQVLSLKKKISQEMDLVSIGQDIALTYAPLQGKISQLFVYVDQIFGGKPVLETQELELPSSKWLKKRHLTERQWIKLEKEQWEERQSDRFREYMKCLNSVMKFKVLVDDKLLDCMGWNRPQFAIMMANLKKHGESTGVSTTKVEQVMMGLAKMQLSKAKMFDMELPEDFKQLEEMTSKNGHDEAKSVLVDDPEADELIEHMSPVNGKTKKNGSKVH